MKNTAKMITLEEGLGILFGDENNICSLGQVLRHIAGSATNRNGYFEILSTLIGVLRGPFEENGPLCVCEPEKLDRETKMLEVPVEATAEDVATAIANSPDITMLDVIKQVAQIGPECYDYMYLWFAFLDIATWLKDECGWHVEQKRASIAEYEAFLANEGGW